MSLIAIRLAGGAELIYCESVAIKLTTIRKWGEIVLDIDSLSSVAMHGGGGGEPVTAPERSHVPIPSRAMRSTAMPTYSAAGRYGEGGTSRMPAIVLAIGLHLALAPALLSLGYQAVKTRTDTLTAVNLAPPPPPPPAAPAPPQSATLQTTVQPSQSAIPVTAPRPVIMMVPTAAPQVPLMALAAPPAPVSTPAPAPPAPPQTVASDSLGTRMISGGPPKYPVESRRKKEQGTVELLLVLGPDGRVETISVARSSGFPRLDEAALSAVRRWRWAPTIRDGAPVNVRGVVEIPFVLTNG